jgi:hypothetical protein
LFWTVPNGLKEDLDEIKLKTIGITLFGFLVLAVTVWEKSKEKVEID